MAALSVAAFHLSLLMGDERYGGATVFADYTSRGNIGVEFFFVLSGFIILTAHGNDIDNPQRFTVYVSKRFTRIYPIYWLYTVVFSTLVFAGFGSAPKIPDSALGWLTTMSLVRFDSTSPPIAPAWTLFHEIAFYSVFSLLVLSRAVGLIAFAIWVCVTVALFQNPIYGNPEPLYMYLAKVNLYFLFGMASTSFSRLKSRLLAAALVLAAIGLAYAGRQVELGPLKEYAMFLYGLGFGGILAGAVSLERSIGIGHKPWISLLGDASYTIYLTHLAFEGLWAKIALRISPDGMSREGLYFSILIAAVFSACLLYLAVERPMLRLLRSSKSRSKTASESAPQHV